MILYTGYSSEEMEIDGEKYLILDVKDIIAKIEG
jgi:chaperonin GroES